MRQYFYACTATLMTVLFLTQAASAGPYAGAQYAGAVTRTVDSKTAYTGEPVELTGVTSADGSVHGARMYGTVTRVVRPGQGRKAQLQITFHKLVLPNGTTYAIAGVVTGMQTKTKNNALKEVGGAVAGMIVGNIIGKTIFHATTGIGGFLGAAGGYLIAKNNRADVVVPAGSGVRVSLRTVRRQSGHY